eukprot:SAG22_NODE_27_length_29018_cov_465.809646_27_plen_179_part_00
MPGNKLFCDKVGEKDFQKEMKTKSVIKKKESKERRMAKAEEVKKKAAKKEARRKWTPCPSERRRDCRLVETHPTQLLRRRRRRRRFLLVLTQQLRWLRASSLSTLVNQLGRRWLVVCRVRRHQLTLARQPPPPGLFAAALLRERLRLPVPPVELAVAPAVGRFVPPRRKPTTPVDNLL